jgi:hypothetical protein
LIGSGWAVARKVELFGWTFAPSDKVMQIENDYDKELYNGDIGYIDDVDPNAGEIVASFDGRSVTYGFGELDMLVPAYATTIHKSRGSEYPAVIIPVLTQHYAMLQRNLLYTGVTRGKRLVVLVGQKQAIAIAVRKVSGRRRWLKLGEQLAPKTPVSVGAPSPSQFQSMKCPTEAGHFITVVMGCVSRPLNLRASRTQTVSPWSRRAVEVDICQSDTCRPDTCQPEQVPEAAAPCEADPQRRQRSASQRMQPLRSESSA